MKKFILAGLVGLMSFGVSALTWVSVSGKVTSITTYASTNTILVTLDKPGPSVSACGSQTVFAISKDLTSEARGRMYSHLLTAKASGSNVTISFQDVGGCEPWNSNPNAYRKIVRLRI